MLPGFTVGMKVVNEVNAQVLCGLRNKNRHKRRINVSPRFESRTVISQSARADEAHRFFDRRFYQTFKNHFY